MIEGHRLRLLLDQNFAKPPSRLRIDLLDKTVEVNHLSSVDPAAGKKSTPDWMVYLIAKEHGQDGVVTSDHAQLSQDAELIALDLSAVALVTWRGRQEDPVVLWGQLLAYMPQIRKVLGDQPRAVIRLPNPRLEPRVAISRPGELARAKQARDGISYSERRTAAVRLMREALAARDASHLERHLDL